MNSDYIAIPIWRMWLAAYRGPVGMLDTMEPYLRERTWRWSLTDLPHPREEFEQVWELFWAIQRVETLRVTRVFFALFVMMHVVLVTLLVRGML